MSDLYYTEDHEYVQVEDDIGIIGISDYAQEQLGDVVYVELPDMGQVLQQTDECGVIESVKIASELYAPISGEVVEVNEALADNPALVNTDPLGDGWLFKIKIEDEGELDNLKGEDEYTDFVDGLAA